MQKSLTLHNSLFTLFTKKKKKKDPCAIRFSLRWAYTFFFLFQNKSAIFFLHATLS